MTFVQLADKWYNVDLVQHVNFHPDNGSCYVHLSSSEEVHVTDPEQVEELRKAAGIPPPKDKKKEKK